MPKDFVNGPSTISLIASSVLFTLRDLAPFSSFSKTSVSILMNLNASDISPWYMKISIATCRVVLGSVASDYSFLRREELMCLNLSSDFLMALVFDFRTILWKLDEFPFRNMGCSKVMLLADFCFLQNPYILSLIGKKILVWWKKQSYDDESN